MSRSAGLLVAAAALVAACAPAPPAPPPPPAAAPVSVVVDAALPRLPLAQFLPGGSGDDHGIALGSIGSDLYPADAPDEYWMVTDRGPNGRIEVGGPDRRTFPVPAFDPLILRVRAQAAAPLEILRTIPVTTADGRPVTGLPNDPARDETPYDLTGNTALAPNPSGIDPEGLARAADGSFWLAEEYAPSVLHLSPTGTVLTRFVPRGLALPGAGYPVADTLPAVYADRQQNRGFESLALSPDGRTLYTALQSPLASGGQESRVVRVLALDTATGRPSAEYVYAMEDVTTFDPGARADQSEMKVSALSWFGSGRLLVGERTDDVTRLYVATLPGATDVLGGEWDDPARTPTLEQAAPPDVIPLTKTLLVDVTAAVPDAPHKIEGIAVRDPQTVAIADDNDFGMREDADAFDDAGRQLDTGVPSRLLVLRLAP